MSTKYKIITVGCQMNVSDSERIDAVLRGGGFTATDEEVEAEIIVVNSCSVRQSAMDRVWGKLVDWQDRRQKRTLKTVLTGCVLAADKAKLKPHFDVLIDIKDIGQLPAALGAAYGDLTENYFAINPRYHSSWQAFVPIMTGCDNFCTFCAVPYTRGREVSRPPEEILAEVTQLISKGCKEITLLGQNVNSYGNSSAVKDDPSRVTFPKLLRLINNLPGNFWVRFITSHPKDASAELFRAMNEGDKLTEHLHLPAQAGDNNILKKMNRHYTIEHYLELISEARKIVPGLAVSTDVIVGFCGETDEQFKKTLDLFNQVKYDMAYLAQYSPRPGTVAEKFFVDDVSSKIKKQREEILNNVLAVTAEEINRRLIDQTLPTLITKRVSTALGPTNKYQGKTRTFKTVQVVSEQDVLGRFVTAKITNCTAWGLNAELVSIND